MAEKLYERQRILDIFRTELDRIPESLPPALPSTYTSKTENSHSVILTGSTGGLGSYFLDDLVCDPAVERVYCLNRRGDGRAAEIELNTLRNLDTNLDEPRVTFLKDDLSKNHFGLALSTNMFRFSRSIRLLLHLLLLLLFLAEATSSQEFTIVEHGETFVPDIVLRVTQVDISQPCVPVKPVVVVNGSTPGPPIYLDEGKTTWIRVYNDQTNSNLTMVSN